MNTAARILVLALSLTPFTNAAAQPAETVAEPEPYTATTPVPRDDAWWVDRHTDKLADKADRLANAKKTDVVFLGDSITQGWEKEGKSTWMRRFRPRGAFNLGYSGDRTEHVLWRLGLGDAGEENNEIAGLTPKLFVVLIGTNNTGHRQDPAEETAAGVEAIVDRLQEVSPTSKVLLLAIFPRGEGPDDPLRKLNEEINELIAPLGERDDVTFLDINNAFLEAMGGLEGAMPDLLHPNQQGYMIWASSIDGAVKRLTSGR